MPAHNNQNMIPHPIGACYFKTPRVYPLLKWPTLCRMGRWTHTLTSVCLDRIDSYFYVIQPSGWST